MALGSFPRAGNVRLHGWDSGAGCWFEPGEVDIRDRADRRLLQSLRSSLCGRKWKLSRRLQGAYHGPICATLQDLDDSILASVEMDGSLRAAPHVVLVVPVQRRPHARAELAFEFASFLRFLRIIGEGAELAVCEFVEAALEQAPRHESLAFSVGHASPLPEVELVLAEIIETLAATVVAWSRDHDRARQRASTAA